MKIPNKYLYFLLSILIYSCEEVTDYEFSTEDLQFIVVNGNLTNERKAHEITVKYPVTSLNEPAMPVSGAYVYVFDGDSLHALEEDLLNPGTYKTDEAFSSVVNRPYTLYIATSEKQYYASTYMLPVTAFNPLKYSFDEEKKLFSIDSVNQAFDRNESAIYEIQVDWTQVEGYETIEKSKKKAVLYYYTLNTIDISQVFAPEKETVYFPAGTTLVESKYSITPEHAGFIRSMLLETEWRGGFFDVAQGNLKTNLSEGAFGYFSVSTVIRDTIIVE
jgi:hypothetical protein